MPIQPTSIETRFWRYAVKKSGCWKWSGAKRHGYGVLNISRKVGTEVASRISWEIHNGPIPDGMCVCHTCDNRACTNPEHLFLGDRKANNQDMWKKGRGRFPHSGHPPPLHVGDTHPQAKLTTAKVRRIRELLRDGNTGRVIAIMFGVTPTTISNILNGKIWKHI